MRREALAPGGADDEADLLLLASHELRGPLTAAFARMQVALRRTEEGRAREAIEQALASLRRLNRTLDNLDGLGAAWERPPEFVVVAEMLAGLAADTCLVSDREIRIECQPGMRVRVRRALLEQTLSNLVGNAVKYSDPPSAICLRAFLGPGEAVFEVEDQGIGIDPEDARRMMERRARGGNVGERPGAGLGLYVARRLCARLGGRLEWRSHVGVGSVFSLHLPLD